MSEFKGTPGPWYAIGSVAKSGQPLGYKPTIVNETAFDQCEHGAVLVEKLERMPCKFIADVRGPGKEWGIPSAETEANAKLIAAAPDLLSICEAAMRIVSLWCPPGRGDPRYSDEDAALHQMRLGIEAAIQKATT